MDVVDRGVGELDVAFDAERLPGIDDVHQVVGDLGEAGRRRFGGADVHAAIDLHRVHS